MKTMLMTALLAATLSASAFPAPTNRHLQYKASENLKSMYGPLKNVSWQPARNNMLKAVFYLGEDAYTVFFEASGEYLATTHNIDMGDIPIMLRLAIDDKFDNCLVAACFELESPNDHAWYFETQTTDGKRQVWKGLENGRIEKERL